MHLKGKILIIVFAAALILTTPVYTKAETGLNDNEQELVEYFQRGIEYEGKHYSIPREYINQGINYLNQDGVDITDEQKSKVYAKVVEMTLEGIRQGYLILDEPSDTNATQSPANTEASAPSDTITGNEPNKSNQPNTTDPSNISTATIPGQNIAEQKAINPDNTAKKGIPELIDAVKDLSDELGVKVSYDAAKRKVNIINDDGNKVMVSDKTIKNTGFQLDQTFIILGGLILLVALCNYLACRYQLFAHQDET